MCHICKLLFDVPYLQTTVWCAIFANYCLMCHICKLLFDVPHLQTTVWCAIFANYCLMCHICKLLFDVPYLQTNVWCAIFANYYLMCHICKLLFDVPYLLKYSSKRTKKPCNSQNNRCKTIKIIEKVLRERMLRSHYEFWDSFSFIVRTNASFSLWVLRFVLTHSENECFSTRLSLCREWPVLGCLLVVSGQY